MTIPGTKKKIVFIFHNSGLTGASLVLLRYVRFLAKTNQHNLYFLLPSHGKIGHSLTTLGTVVDFNAVEIPSLPARILGKLGFNKPQTSSVERALNALLQIKPDLVYCNTVASSDFVVACKQNIPVPVVLHIHELAKGVELTGVDPSSALNKADIIIANSETTADFLRSKYNIGGKIHIHHPVIPEPQLKKHRHNTNAFVVGSAGTALPTKGAFAFIELAREITDLDPASRYDFVWVGNFQKHKTEIESLIHQNNLLDKIKFTGETDNPLEQYAGMDVFVSLSQEESFGLACMEAASIGVPVAAYAGAGEIEHLVRSCNGIVVSYNDINAMAKSIIQLCTDNTKRDEMSRGGVEFASSFFPEKIIPQWMETLESAMQKSTSRS